MWTGPSGPLEMAIQAHQAFRRHYLCFAISPAGLEGCYPLNFLNLINLKFRVRAELGHLSKKEGKYRELIQPDSGYQWESDNATIRHHKREPRGQPFPSR